MNIPAIEVMSRAGHKKFETTMKYYVNRSEESRKLLLNALNGITTDEQLVEVPDGNGGTQLVPESRARAIAQANATMPH